jgi:hypothetical protein
MDGFFMNSSVCFESLKVMDGLKIIFPFLSYL